MKNPQLAGAIVSAVAGVLRSRKNLNHWVLLGIGTATIGLLAYMMWRGHLSVEGFVTYAAVIFTALTGSTVGTNFTIAKEDSAKVAAGASVEATRLSMKPPPGATDDPKIPPAAGVPAEADDKIPFS